MCAPYKELWQMKMMKIQGQIYIMALNSIDTANTFFVVDEGDISMFTFDLIVGVLNEPELQCSGTRLKYKFKTKIPVCEKWIVAYYLNIHFENITWNFNCLNFVVFFWNVPKIGNLNAF